MSWWGVVAIWVNPRTTAEDSYDSLHTSGQLLFGGFVLKHNTVNSITTKYKNILISYLWHLLTDLKISQTYNTTFSNYIWMLVDLCLYSLYNWNQFYESEYFGTIIRNKLLKPTFQPCVNSVCKQKVHNQNFCQRNKLLIIWFFEQIQFSFWSQIITRNLMQYSIFIIITLNRETPDFTLYFNVCYFHYFSNHFSDW